MDEPYPIGDGRTTGAARGRRRVNRPPDEVHAFWRVLGNLSEAVEGYDIFTP